MGKPNQTGKIQKDSITVNYKEIVQILRIITIVLILLVLSIVLIYYGVFSPESYIGCIALFLVSGYILLPLVFCFSSHLQQSLVFQPNVDIDDMNFDNPDGLLGVRNFKIMTNSDIHLGIWHILPANKTCESKGQDSSFWKDCIKQDTHKGVIIYFHGVTGTRGKPHRKELYKVLQNENHHIISCDYRGFGDSTKVRRISETGVVTDALNVYKWVQQELLDGNSHVPVFVWGHSLGTGISSHVLAKLNEHDDIPLPKGLILESPFDNFAEELRNHSKLKLWSRLPFFEHLVIRPLRRNDIIFQTDHHVSKISIPIIILHAKDDHVIPSFLGKRLFEIGKLRKSFTQNPMYFIHMNGGRHNEICKFNVNFGTILQEFISACSSIGDKCWHHHYSDPDNVEILCTHC